MADMIPGMTNQAVEAFLARAANIGANAKVLESEAKAQVDADAKAAADARDLLRDSKRRAAGFRRPAFRALGEVAAAFQSASNNLDSVPETFRESVASRAAQAFAASYTGRSEKSAKGGVAAGWTHVIYLGSAGQTLINALAERVDHWQAIADLPINDEGAAALRETALRYVTPAASCPAPDGRIEPGKLPKHNGRAAVTLTVDGKTVSLPARGATNRDAILAEAARLARTHGIEVATHPFVLDAVLDNGGKWRKPEGDAQALAADALSALDKLLSLGGAESLDGASLMVMRDVIHRIAQQGLRERPMVVPEVANTPILAAPQAMPENVSGSALTVTAENEADLNESDSCNASNSDDSSPNKESKKGKKPSNIKRKPGI